MSQILEGNMEIPMSNHSCVHVDTPHFVALVAPTAGAHPNMLDLLELVVDHLIMIFWCDFSTVDDINWEKLFLKKCLVESTQLASQNECLLVKPKSKKTWGNESQH